VTHAADDAHALASALQLALAHCARRGSPPIRPGGFRRFNARVRAGIALPPATPAHWRALADQGRANASERRRYSDMYQLEARTARARMHPPRILSEHSLPLPERSRVSSRRERSPAPAGHVVGARALLDFAPLALEGKAPWPAWLAPHQVPAASGSSAS